jgi:hypothetical protein
MYILWIIYFVGMIIAFAGLFKNSYVYLFLGGVTLLSATLVSFFIALKRYRDYTTKGNKKRLNLFLTKNINKGLKDTKEGDKNNKLV